MLVILTGKSYRYKMNKKELYYGIFDNLAKNAALWGAVEASKDENGKPDPYKAAGIAAGMGNFSFSDRLRLGAMLGSQGVFDTNTDDDYSAVSGYGGVR